MLLAVTQKWFAEEDQTSLAWFRDACEARRQSLIDTIAPLLFPASLTPDDASSDFGSDALIEQLWAELIAALSGDEERIENRLAAFGSYAACSGTDLRSLADAVEAVRGHVVHQLVESYVAAPRKLEGALAVMQRLFDRALHAVTREYLSYREALMEEQRRREDAEHRRAVELQAENLRIQAASRLKSEFLANMSHELRTPLNSIIGFADLLYDREIAPDTPQHHEFLGDILKSARHLLKLINDVLDLAKVEAGKMEFRPEELDLNVLVSEVADVLHSQAIGREIALYQQVSPDVSSVFADPARLRQVLYNYLSNAIKFTPARGRITIRAFAVGEREFRIEVEDTGIGISEEDLDRLFVEFEQLPHMQSVNCSGTGLGLALTKRIVEAQGGRVGARSVLGEGSMFWVMLPSEPDSGRAPQPASYFQELRPSSAPKAGNGRAP
ncbi:MAG: sensor hybrid histidine kinase [Myxococcaceae bacterium]|nr:sensor hybrid histidine kinase [Myxococcaceae bacterium]